MLARKIGTAALAYAIIICMPLTLAHSLASPGGDEGSGPELVDGVNASVGDQTGLDEVEQAGEPGEWTGQHSLRFALFGDTRTPSGVYEMYPVEFNWLLAAGAGQVVLETRYSELLLLDVLGTEEIDAQQLEVFDGLSVSAAFVDGYVTNPVDTAGVPQEIGGLIIQVRDTASGDALATGAYLELDSELWSAGINDPTELPLCAGTLDVCLRIQEMWVIHAATIALMVITIVLAALSWRLPKPVPPAAPVPPDDCDERTEDCLFRTAVDAFNYGALACDDMFGEGGSREDATLLNQCLRCVFEVWDRNEATCRATCGNGDLELYSQCVNSLLGE